MATVLLFHHALGLTEGVRAFAEALRGAGHSVHCPDLYGGLVFDGLSEGVAHAEQLGFEAIITRGVATADGLPSDVVYAGFSLGVLPAQKLAQTRPGARGALLYHEALPPATFDSEWREGVALQIHMTENDPWADRDAARKFERDEGAELFIYPGDAHLFADSSFDEFDPNAAALLMMRTTDFLARIG